MAKRGQVAAKVSRKTGRLLAKVTGTRQKKRKEKEKKTREMKRSTAGLKEKGRDLNAYKYRHVCTPRTGVARSDPLCQAWRLPSPSISLTMGSVLI